MELFVKVITVCVIFTCVTAELELNFSTTESTGQPSNLTKTKEDREAQLKKHLMDCSKETKVDPKLISKIRSGMWRQALRRQPPSLKQWALCLLVKSQMMSPDGVLRQDVVLEYVPEKDRAKVEKVIDYCLYKKAHSPSDIAWHYVTCFRNQLSKYSII